MRSCRTVALIAVLVLGTGITARAQERGQAEKPTTRSSSGPVLGQAAQAAGVEMQKGSGARVVVDYIAHAPSPAGEGQSIAISIQVKNEGTAPSSGEEVLYLECENAQAAGPACPFPASQLPLPVLQPASAPHASGPKTDGVYIQTLPSWKMGSYTLRAWVAVPRQPSRSAISTASLQVVAPVPDLVVTSVVPYDPASSLVFPLEVTVKNRGLGKSNQTSLSVKVTCQNPPGEGCLKNKYGQGSGSQGKTVPMMGVGATEVIIVPSAYGSDFHSNQKKQLYCIAVECKITVFVDFQNFLQELNELNNTKVHVVAGTPGAFPHVK